MLLKYLYWIFELNRKEVLIETVLIPNSKERLDKGDSPNKQYLELSIEEVRDSNF